MIMHRKAEDAGWVGFWNFHEGGRVLSENFQTRHGVEHNFWARLDWRLGRFIYREPAINLDNGAEQEIILSHDATYIRHGAGALWQRRWHRYN